MKAAKPPSGAWMTSQRAGLSAVPYACGTPHGDESAGAGCDRLAFGSDLEDEVPFQNVEGLGVLVDVAARHGFAAARPA